jgi:phosphoribosylanthranilate isomerase
VTVRVKICGITRAEDAAAAVRHGAAAVGFVFWPGSPRRVDAARALAIGRELPSTVIKVGVFVNASPDEVAATIAEAGLDAAQLHGDEDALAYTRVPARLIKSVAPASLDDVSRALRLPAHVTVLVDAVDRERHGGTGRRASWPLAAAIARERPILLAGGLTADSVAEAIAVVRPWGLDVSSGVEDAPGIKSEPRIAALCAAVRAAEQTPDASREGTS